LPAAADPLMRHIDLQLAIRMDINKKILDMCAVFVTATGLSCRQASSHAMHQLIVDLMQLGASLKRDDPDTAVDVLPIIDEFTDHTIATWIHKRGDDSLNKAMNALEDVHFVNLVLDSGTVYSLKSIPCLLTNPYHIESPILLDLRENTNFTKQDYLQLFRDLFDQIRDKYGLALCSVIIDNLYAQSFGLDQLIADAELPVIHVKCFAHMTNLVLSNSGNSEGFRNVMSILEDMQKILSKPRGENEDSVGAKCPDFIRTRWCYMVDVLEFIFRNNVRIQQIFGRIPTEIFELYAILLPYLLFTRAVESRKTPLSSIIQLVRCLLAQLKSALALLKTRCLKGIFRDMYIRLMARLMVNNREECITAYILTDAGRFELAMRERGYSGQVRPRLGPPEDRNVNFDTRHDGDYAAVNELILNSDREFDKDYDGSDFARGVLGEDEPPDVFCPEKYKDFLLFFSHMSDAELLEFDPYDSGDMYKIGLETIKCFACRMDLDVSATARQLDTWLYGGCDDIVFLQSFQLGDFPDTLWRKAHRFGPWSVFSDLALRFITCGTSEADAERVFSLQKHFAGLHGTRLGVRTMSSRIRGYMANQHVITEEIESSADAE
jgi:hypothetical protein